MAHTMKVSLLFLIMICMLTFAGSARAQISSPSSSNNQVANNARVEQAQRFQSGGTTESVAGQDGGLIPAGLAPTSPGDADIGQQVLLKRTNKATPFSAFATVSGYYTNNAALTNAVRVD